MVTTPNLGITHLTSNQNQPEVTVNAAIDALDESENDSLAITITANRTLTAAEFNANHIFILNGTPSAFDLTVPNQKRKFSIENNTGVIATVKAAGAGAADPLSGGKRRLYWTDGTDIKPLAPDHDVTGGGGVAGAFGPKARGALVKLTSDVNNINGGVILSWEVEEYDTDDIWTISPNPERLTVPSGVTKVRVSWGMEMTFATSIETLFVSVRKNGVDVQGGGNSNYTVGTGGFSDRALNSSSAILEVNAGDYFTIRVNYSNTVDDNIQAAVGTYFALEIVERTPPRALLKIFTSQQITENTPTVLNWDAATYDPESLFTITQPSVLDIPANAVKARLRAAVRWESNASGYRRIRFLKNGSPHFDGNAVDTRAAVGGIETEVVIQTPVLDVIQGDEFEVEVEHNSTQSGGINVEAQTDAGSPAGAATWFAIEIVE